MNICILAGATTRTQAGATHALVEFANALAQIPSIGVHLYAHSCDRAWIHPAIDVLEYAPPRRRPVLWRFKHLRAVAEAETEMRRHPLAGMDLCFSNGLVWPLAFRRLYPSVPIVSHTGYVLAKRERREENQAEYRWYSVLDTMLADRLEARTYREPSWSHLVSTNFVAREREKYFGLPPRFFHVCPYGLNLAKFNRDVRHPDMRGAFGVPDSAVVLVTVARLVHLKNIQLILHAIAKCRRRDVYLFVVGDGNQRDPLAALARKLAVDDRVRFIGHRNNPAPFYAASDIFVLPSVVESFGIVYAEAMLMGLPCIGLRSDPPRVLSAAEDVIVEGSTGYCVRDLDELVEKLELLSGDPALRARMGQEGCRRARARYSAASYVDFVLSLAHRQFGISVPSPKPARRAGNGVT